MGYPYAGPEHYPSRPSAGYGAYWPQATRSADQRTGPKGQLAWAVLALGLATYLVSYAKAAPGGIGWDVRFSALAAIVAAVGLLPGQAAHTKSMLALAVMGFLEALSRCIGMPSGQDVGWVAIVIAVLNALQALAAIAALLTEPKAPGAPDGARNPYEEAYAYYAHAAQQYYAANDQRGQREQVQAHATAQAESAASAQAQRSEADRYALYAEYLAAQQPGPNPAAARAQPVRPGQTPQPAAGAGIPAGEPAESLRVRDDPATGSPTQSFP